MADIIEFPRQPARGAILRKHIEILQDMAVDGPHPVIESILSLMEQVQRTNASIAAYQTELKVRSQEGL